MIKRPLILSCSLLLATCLFMSACKSSAASPDASPATAEPEKAPPARTPSKLEQADWQSPPPGMPEEPEVP